MGRKAQKRPKHLGRKLVQIRRHIGATQAKMAEMLRYFGAEETTHSGYVADFETSQRVPSLFTLLAYSKLTGLSVNALIDDAIDISESLPSQSASGWIMKREPTRRAK